MTRARAGAGVAALVALAAAACGDPEPITVVFVTVQAPPTVSGVEDLAVTIRNRGSSVSETFDVADLEFPLTFSVTPTDRTGDVDIDVDGTDGDGQVRAQGHARATIQPDERVDVALRLEPTDFVVNSGIAGSQRLTFGDESTGRQLAVGPTGSFVVTWVNDCSQLSRCDVLARLFAADASPARNDTTMDSSDLIANLTDEFTDNSAVAFGPAGSFVAWETIDGVKGAALTATAGHLDSFETEISAVATNATTVAVAALETGEYVAVWSEDLPDVDGSAIRGRFVDADGQPIVNPTTGDDLDFPVSTSTTGFARAPAVSATGDGRGFVVVWRHSATSAGAGNLFARFFGPTGSVQSASQAQLTSYAAAIVRGPHVAALADGSAVVAWRATDDSDPRLSDGALLVDTFAPPLGVPLGPETLLASPLETDGNVPALAVRGDGARVAAWHDCGGSGDDEACGIRLQVLRPSGLPVGDPVVVNTTLTGDQTGPSIAPLSDGFFVVWTDDSEAAPDTDGSSVRGRAVYPAFDVADGRRGARCGEADDSPCAGGLACVADDGDEPLCHDTCQPENPIPCPRGGNCTPSADGGACRFD